MIVLEGRPQPVTMATRARDRLVKRGHHDVGVGVAVATMGAMRVLDDLEQPMHVRFGFVLVAVLVLVSVPMRHGSMLGQARGRPWPPPIS